MMMRGKVKWFDSHKGYGFVHVEKIGEAIIHPEDFVDERGVPNWDEIKAKVVPGAVVEFMGVYRIRAVNIRVLTKEDMDRLLAKGSA
jgi:hypothetical protein